MQRMLTGHGNQGLFAAMTPAHNSFLNPTFLRSVWADEYAAFKDTPAEAALLERLRNWAARPDVGETSAEAAFVATFFRDTWGYVGPGQGPTADGHTMIQQFTIPGTGAGGGAGRADLALGYLTGSGDVPQAVCEFKATRRGRATLDSEQSRKGSRRSPVDQCLDYLSGARRGMIGSEPILPRWGIVTDMNEFRLYWYDRGKSQFLPFVIRQPQGDLFRTSSLLDDSDEARFGRYLFSRVFHRDLLLTRGGKPGLLNLIEQRRFRDRQIETEFYGRYKAFRDLLINTLVIDNGPHTPRYPGTNGRLVRMAQKILDRLLFVFYCEDMGRVLAFPPKLLQEFLSARSADPYYDPNATTIWADMTRLFHAMNAGTTFGREAIHRFNGGLFAHDAALDALHVPNRLFCEPNQAQNEASIAAAPLTVLYLCATYNYAATLGEGNEREALGLYTLGHIFEQSITELEMLEAQADGRPSVNKLSGRKTDGVYYTPEWVVERLVDGTIGPRLVEMQREAGWPENNPPDGAAVERYRAALRRFTVLDPACGSGAFLITALRYLETAWRNTEPLRDVGAPSEPMHDFLATAIHGVDINPSSVEIAQLALWLHTARSDRPLSSLDATVKSGNSLVPPAFYVGLQGDAFDDARRERVNAFDWHAAFPEVFARGGFDAVVANPPYVKLQNYRPAHPDVAEWLVNGRVNARKPYESTRTGNFDLYLPFIEMGLRLLRSSGRMGYIAPSVWTVNEYGEGLRNLISRGQHLDRWLDFRSYQVFEEATVYTALQLFSRSPTNMIRVAEAPRGPTQVPPNPWVAGGALSWGDQDHGDRWVMLAGEARALIDRLARDCRPLAAVTTQIFVGVQTSADAIFHLDRIGPGRYRCRPPGTPRPLAYEVEVEDGIMRPLVSGAEAKRYIVPTSGTHILYPYKLDAEGHMRLVPAATMQRDFPRAWAHLMRFRETLEGREAKRVGETITRPFADDGWYRFGRSQNIDKQNRSKLVLPRLVNHLVAAYDEFGNVCLDNVDVGGILIAAGTDPWFLLGILNAPVADFIFRRVSKPFRGDYLSANRQFIKDLPIPNADASAQATVATLARDLQRLHTDRRQILADLGRRLDFATRARPPEWLFHGLPAAEDFALVAPTNLRARDRSTRAMALRDAEIARREAAVGAALRPGARLSTTLVGGELRLLADGAPVLDRVFVTAAEGPFVHAVWRRLTATTTVTERLTGKALCDKLRCVPVTTNTALVAGVIELSGKLDEAEKKIEAAEAALNEASFVLYGLSAEERAMVLSG
jgi:N-6 DNA Methylase/TaqI-like C-terminal specificity domain